MMQIQQYGQRNPQLDRILITGGGLTGKTTLAAKFASSPDRALFISTDGNAARQGYQTIVFEYPQNVGDVLNQFKKTIDFAFQHHSNFDVLVWDLAEDIDEYMQVGLRDELADQKSMLRAWGKIHLFYKFAQTHLMTHLRKHPGKKTILLSRDVEEYGKGKDKDKIIGYIPALRKVLKNIILKDQDAEIRCYFEQKQRKFEVTGLRFEEMRPEIMRVINSPLVLPQAPAISPKVDIENLKNDLRIVAMEEGGIAFKTEFAKLDKTTRNAVGDEFKAEIKAIIERSSATGGKSNKEDDAA